MVVVVVVVVGGVGRRRLECISLAEWAACTSPAEWAACISPAEWRMGGWGGGGVYLAGRMGGGGGGWSVSRRSYTPDRRVYGGCFALLINKIDSL